MSIKYLTNRSTILLKSYYVVVFYLKPMIGNMEDDIKAVLNEICAGQDSEDLASDMIAIFEDIKRFFVDQAEDFIDFDSLSEEAKEALYIEIKLLIALLKKLRGTADKAAITEVISKNLIIILSKNRDKYHTLLKESLNKKEQEEFKKRFAETTLLELYKEYRLSLACNKASNPKLMEAIEAQVQRMKGCHSSYSKSLVKRHHKPVLPRELGAKRGRQI